MNSFKAALTIFFIKTFILAGMFNFSFLNRSDILEILAQYRIQGLNAVAFLNESSALEVLFCSDLTSLLLNLSGLISIIVISILARTKYKVKTLVVTFLSAYIILFLICLFNLSYSYEIRNGISGVLIVGAGYLGIAFLLYFKVLTKQFKK